MSKLQVYPLFVALTRQPMMMGVTQNFFVINITASLCFFLIFKSFLIPIIIFFILHTTGVICCRIDERFIEIWQGKFSLSCPNRPIWGCNSYDPS